jgi:hypothetical protein
MKRFWKASSRRFNPSDVIEQMWTREVADLSWRMRHLEALNMAAIDTGEAQGAERDSGAANGRSVAIWRARCLQ